MDEAALQRLLDESELRNLILGLPRALDARDWDAFAESFADDGVFEPPGQSFRGREAIAGAPKHGLAPLYEATYHHMGQIYVDLQGDEANLVAYGVGYHLPKASDPGTQAVAGGKYHAAARRTEAGWRFTRIRLEFVLFQGIPLRFDPQGGRA